MLFFWHDFLFLNLKYKLIRHATILTGPYLISQDLWSLLDVSLLLLTFMSIMLSLRLGFAFRIRLLNISVASEVARSHRAIESTSLCFDLHLASIDHIE